MLPIYEAIADPLNKRITGIMATQMGKTDFLLNIIGESADTKSQPILLVEPTQNMAETISKDRFKKMVAQCESLSAKIDKDDSVILEKWIAGNRIGFIWASSSNQLCMNPAALVVVDERDRMANDVDGQGDPVEQVSARTTTYPNFKLVIVTTPTIKGASPGWRLYEQGTQHRWHLVCLKCGKLFLPSLESFSYERKPYRGFVTCQHCKTKFCEQDRKALLAHGQYIAEVPNAANVSFWVSGLCSPWRTWDNAAQQLGEAEEKEDPNLMKTCVNTVFGECFAVKGESITVELFENLKQTYQRGTIPDGVLVITCGCDVHKDNIYYVIRGWGKDNKSWLLDYGILFGNTEEEEIWQKLDIVIKTPVGNDKKKMKIRIVCIDCGYRTGIVYEYCKRMPDICKPCKGYKWRSSPISPVALEITVHGQRFRAGGKRLDIDDGYFKTLLFSRVVNQQWFLPAKIDDEFLKQITSEEQIINEKGQMIWKEKYNNHYLDCEKLNMVAAESLHVHLLDSPQDFQRVRSEGIDIWQ